MTAEKTGLSDMPIHIISVQQSTENVNRNNQNRGVKRIYRPHNNWY